VAPGLANVENPEEPASVKIFADRLQAIIQDLTCKWDCVYGARVNEVVQSLRRKKSEPRKD
jgi:hypothetical protein